ncbi:uncharacterized protein TRIADDRAFT_52798 [Trichoplax adhaerens]|uniref:Uncharacterized protein n=1 Tax=Trichoplax adhaerens TaxID=10228 RepID=B3RKC8_TRIAD|nr:predicted protein [Trichoplax adhaerens]EDV29905.1 predicted protein [Trichoplax adhaerens]|eukprot:XP_002109107.1 predicted protein [Trichoplax adhaerens]
MAFTIFCPREVILERWTTCKNLPWWYYRKTVINPVIASDGWFLNKITNDFEESMQFYSRKCTMKKNRQKICKSKYQHQTTPADSHQESDLLLQGQNQLESEDIDSTCHPEDKCYSDSGRKDDYQAVTITRLYKPLSTWLPVVPSYPLQRIEEVTEEETTDDPPNESLHINQSSLNTSSCIKIKE